MGMAFKTRAVVVTIVAFLLVIPFFGREAGAAQLIRDSEIETTIRAYATPLFEAGGLNPGDIRIFLVSDESLNAFVAGGMNLFLNTGLLRRAGNANELIGVIAHETGHITGGHLVRFSQRSRSASTAATVSTVLGILTAIATGSGEAGVAVVQGGQGLAMDSLLGYSRAQESAADQAALKLLGRTGQSPRGIRDFLKKIEDQELIPASRQDPYLRTHPLTRSRIDHVERELAESPFADAETPPEFRRMFRRMQAKLRGFMDPPSQTLNRVPTDDDSIEARYSRSIAYFRQGSLDQALPLIDGLISQEPETPWFHELKGQMLFDYGQIADALPAYRKALELAPDALLIRLALATVQIATEKPEYLEPAIRNLLRVTAAERENATAWDQLAIAYGRNDQFGLSALAAAEAAMARGQPDKALDHVTRAERRLENDTSAWLRAQDIRREAERTQAERR